MTRTSLALCQLNPVVGALERNTDDIIERVEQATSANCHVAVFGELAVCGYPPEDLLLKQRFIDDCAASLQRIAAATTTCAVVVGFPERIGSNLFNSAAICHSGEVRATYQKQLLPSYAVFDEQRWFTAGPRGQDLVQLSNGLMCGVSVCEDIWHVDGPTVEQGVRGAELLININGSPFHSGKLGRRQAMLAERSRAADAAVAYVNQVGGQDELIFDGGSMVFDRWGHQLAGLPQFEEAFEVVVLDTDGSRHNDSSVFPALERNQELWSALVTGTRDYIKKNGFSEVVVGLSGGIDSSIVATLAADAIGSQNVHGVLMPSRYSSAGSISDAERLCDNLKIRGRVIPIEAAHHSFEHMLATSFSGTEPDLTEENLQSRIRGVTLMALSNKFGWMVLTTGNKSESAVGYSTLYGDTAGGLAVIKDLYKLLVYELCEWRNEVEGTELIPSAVLNKPPSAELRPDQRDDQSLPPYEILDPILEGYIDGDLTADQLIDVGHDAAVVRRITRLVDLAEYKRRQTPPGLRVTSKAFGRDRRLPITNHYS